MRDGTELRFVGEGSDPALKRPGDLVVVLKLHEHKKFEREGDDLIYHHEISLADALTSAPVQFETLEGEVITFRSDEVISPQTYKVFPGKGMPIYNDNPLSPLMHNHTHGNLILRFKIQMPQKLSDG